MEELDLTPRLPPPVLSHEVEEGRVEYKMHLHTASPERLQRLASQLNWRLREGSGRCIYFLGVADDGFAVGIDAQAAAGSLAALRSMAAEVGAAVAGVTAHHAAAQVGCGGGDGGGRAAGAEADARCVLRVELTRKASGAQLPGEGGGAAAAPPRAPAGAPQPRGPPPAAGGGGCDGGVRAPFFEPRIALLGAKGSGKTTLVAALSAGQLDDGAGAARGSVVRHRHELEAGCTSSISCWTVGLDAVGGLVPPARDDVSVASAGSEGHDLLSFRGAAPSDARVHARSASTVALLDLPGRRRCFRSLLSGLLGGAPHGALLVVDGAAARAAGGPCAATVAHADLLVALAAPFATVVTRAELLCGGERARVAAALRAGGAAAGGGGAAPAGDLLFVSCVTGEGLPELARLLWRAAGAWPAPPPPRAPPPALANVLDTWVVGPNLVVGCLCVAGSLAEGDALRAGPLDGGDGGGAWHAVSAVSVHVRGGAAPDGALRAGELGSVSLGPPASLPAGGLRARRLRRGCVLVGGAAGGVPLARRVRVAANAGGAAARALQAAAGGGASRFPWREGASVVLVGASGLKANATIGRVDAQQDGGGGGLTLELARAEHVPAGKAVLCDGGVGFIVVEVAEFSTE